MLHLFQGDTQFRGGICPGDLELFEITYLVRDTRDNDVAASYFQSRSGTEMASYPNSSAGFARISIGLKDDFRLHQERGAAATKLRKHGLSLSEISNHVGWSIRSAFNVIEHCTRISLGEIDPVLVKLSQAIRGIM